MNLGFFQDERGFFLESFNQKAFDQAVGAHYAFVQDNHSSSVTNILRGLHYQVQKRPRKTCQSRDWQYLRCCCRYPSGLTHLWQISRQNFKAPRIKKQLWIPPGFAHGFYVLSETADVLYKATDFYSPEHERSIVWNDPDLNIQWPTAGKTPIFVREGCGWCYAQRGRFGGLCRLFGRGRKMSGPTNNLASDRTETAKTETPKRVLLVGAQGQVGQELVQTLSRLPNLGTVVAVGRKELDLTDLDAIAQQVAQVQPSLIINAAAYTAVDKAESEPDLAHCINAEAPKALAQSAVKCGAALVHISTDYVFPGTEGSPRTETDPTGPLSVYGKTKLAGEEAIRATLDQHIILRTAWVYGSQGKGNFFKDHAAFGQRPQHNQRRSRSGRIAYMGSRYFRNDWAAKPSTPERGHQ